MHDSIITAGNGGLKPTSARFTIFYNQGRDRYDIEQQLQPDEQMWIDVAKLIREGVPDKTGKTLPADLEVGAYEFNDLVNHGVGALFEGKVIYDKTFGHVAYGCAACCAYRGPHAIYNPLGLAVGSLGLNGVDALDVCAGGQADISGDFWNWNTTYPSIAKTDVYGHHTGMSLGTTPAVTSGQYEQEGSRLCIQQSAAPTTSAAVGIKLVLVENDCSSTSSTGRMHAGWGNNGLSGCLLSADVPYNIPLTTGGACVANPGVFEVYKYQSAGKENYAYPISSRIADKVCTRFIDAVTDGVIITTVVP